jgi:alpha-galactosidase
VRDYLFAIVSDFMNMPGFRVYRQDFNMDPLPHWAYSDPPDRQGMSEIKYIQGLYDFWDRIAATWPDSLRIECAGGGRRIDLETVMRMHVHQKSDYWFHDEVDQASVWGLSQYLPNNVFMTPINRMDDYSFHSALATSLCVGWIADAPDFDRRCAAELLDTYQKVRPLLIGDWYPLLPYSRDLKEWIAFQFHRADLDEGMILAFRRPQCPRPTVKLALHGLNAERNYAVSFHSKKDMMNVMGVDLMRGLTVALPNQRQSDLIRYSGAERPRPC